jgi:serine-type D-Ala-D-Ala carboxypeptidase/endopeptidase
MVQVSSRIVCGAAVVAGLMATLLGAQATNSSAVPVLPSDRDIRQILVERVDAQGKGVGIVVGVIGPGGRRVISYGQISEEDPRLLDGDTVFEIGSMTKVFTALVLADMLRRGEIALEDPIAKYLPVGVKLPERNGRPITFLDVATHTSGLPLMPDGLPPLNEFATAKYSDAQLYQFLAGYELPRQSGIKWDYSNIGYTLLGRALAARAGMDYEALLRTRILAPLALNSTGITLSPTLKAKLAIGHDASLRPTPPISSVPIMAVMTPTGGVLSTVDDMLTFLSVAMGYGRSPLAPAMATMLSTRRPSSGGEQALGWMVTGKGDDQLIVHDGGTFGYASSMVWDPKMRLGVVVLSNHVANVGDVARHLLRPNRPLAKPTATKRTEIALDSEILDSYAGNYASGTETFIIMREGAFLTIQLPADWGLPQLRLRPESLREFFAAELPLRVAFEHDNEGRVTGLLVYPPRGQKVIPAIRSDK